MLPATERLQAYNVDRMIRQRSYFIVHAPRQVGKTTAMYELARELTASGEYVAVWLSCETGAPFFNETETAERAMVASWQRTIQVQLASEFHPKAWSLESVEGDIISSFLSAWSEELSRPLVIFLDEIDALQDEALISVLRQLRSGYTDRPSNFPAALAIIGLRDVRDYKVKSGGRDRLTSPSPFNIAVRSITLRNFSAEEVHRLLTQHTEETGQSFLEAAIERIFYLTQGQPWLVNSLAKVCVEELVEDWTLPILVQHVDEAKEILIQRRQTHLDSLADKLNEIRVRQIIEPLLGGQLEQSIPQDDLDYVIDLGLVRRVNGSFVIANPIYEEIVPRALTASTEAFLPRIRPIWLTENGKLDIDKLRDAFLAFWRQHGQPLLRTAPYHEIAPHLVMMAFLHRVVNGGGTIEREYAIGSGRMDLLVRYGETRLALELKTWRDGKKDPETEGLKQLDRYLDGLGLETGWLVIFDQRSDLPPIEERTTSASATTPAGRDVVIIRG